METKIDKIKKLSQEKEDENWKFRSFLKGCEIPSKQIDSVVNEQYEEASSKIDCRRCMNCCRQVSPVLDGEDAEKLSGSLHISPNRFKDKYLVKDEEDQGFKFNTLPCPFLEDGGCSYYECRPKDCRSFPHLHKEGFIFRLIDVITNCSICPIVFNVYEQLKKEIWDKSREEARL